MTKYPQAVVDSAAWTVPLGRLGTEEEFAWLVAYLASPGRRLPLGHGAHSRRRARQLVRRVAAGRAHGRGREAARRGEAAEGVSKVPELRTERLLMRGWRDEDLRALAAIIADPTVRAGLGQARRPDAGRGLASTWPSSAGHWALKGYGHWVLEEREQRASSSGAPGSTTRRTGPASRSGWTVAREHWGKGYAPEAGARRVRVGARRAGRAAHRQPDRPVERAARSGSRRSSASGSRAASSTRGFDLLVYGADLPLAVRPLTGGYRAAHDENEEDARDPLRRARRRRPRPRGRRHRRPRPEYEDEEGDDVGEASAPLIEGGEGVEEGFEVAEDDLREAASHGENRYDPSTARLRRRGERRRRRRRSRRGRRVEVPDESERRRVRRARPLVD